MPAETQRLQADAVVSQPAHVTAADQQPLDALATPERQTMRTEQPNFAEALTAWWPFRDEGVSTALSSAPGGAASTACSGSAHDVSMVKIDCSELGGASRSATWSMRADETLRDARDAAAVKFQLKGEEAEICIAGVPQSAPWLVNARLGSLRESLVNVGGVWGGPLQLQVRAREGVLSRPPS
jgi:hypothetical protein